MSPKLLKEEEGEFDREKFWENVERAASRVPNWASLEPPYSVKPEFVKRSIPEEEVGDD